MPAQNSIDVVVHPAGEDSVPIEANNVQYISLVNGETYGIPALIADDSVKREGLPVRILYVNPENIATMEAVRRA